MIQFREYSLTVPCPLHVTLQDRIDREQQEKDIYGCDMPVLPCATDQVAIRKPPQRPIDRNTTVYQLARVCKQMTATRSSAWRHARRTKRGTASTIAAFV